MDIKNIKPVFYILIILALSSYNIITYIYYPIYDFYYGDEYKHEYSYDFQLFYSETPSTNNVKLGMMEYHSSFDSIPLDENDFRLVSFHVGAFKKKHTLAELKKEKLSSCSMLDEEKGHFLFSIAFQEKGENILDGYIEDRIYLTNYYPDGQTKVLRKEVQITDYIAISKD